MQKATITTAAVAAATMGLLCGTAALSFAQLPKKAAPQGMIEIPTGGQTSGRILTSKMGGTTSAHKMLQALKMVSGEYFDKPFVVTRAFADRDDQNLQAAFTARLKGIPVHGVASVRMQGETGQGTLLFDDAKTLNKSFRGLVSRQTGSGAGNSGGNAGANVPLTRQTAPDGSCQISLPPGYQITGSYKGVLDITGPNKAAMALGSYLICTRPEAAQMFPGIPTVNFNDPVQAMIDYAHYMGRKAGVNINVKVLDYKPIPNWSPGRAAYVRYSVQFANQSQEGFGLFSVAATDTNQALFYQSFISAPTATYRQSFPGMMGAWGTWSINPSVFTERLMAAAQSMRGMSDVITSGYNNRQQTEARVSEAWSDAMRDQTTWSKPDEANIHHKISNVYTNGGGIPTVDGVPLQPVPLSGL